MSRDADRVCVQVQLEPEVRDMLKADAKALGMVPSKYVSLLVRVMNETCRETATAEMAGLFAKSVLRAMAK